MKANAMISWLWLAIGLVPRLALGQDDNGVSQLAVGMAGELMSTVADKVKEKMRDAENDPGCIGPHCCAKSTCSHMPGMHCHDWRGDTRCIGASMIPFKQGMCACLEGYCGVDGKCPSARLTSSSASSRAGHAGSGAKALDILQPLAGHAAGSAQWFGHASDYAQGPSGLQTSAAQLYSLRSGLKAVPDHVTNMLGFAAGVALVAGLTLIARAAGKRPISAAMRLLSPDEDEDSESDEDSGAA